MKIEDVPRPGLLALGVLGVAATAVLGFAAGLAAGRDPEVLRRTARGVARGLERATLMAAQAREYVGDLWAEVREEAVTEVDTADFARAAARAAKPARPAATTAMAASAAPRKTPRKRPPSPRKPRAARKATAQSGEARVTDRS